MRVCDRARCKGCPVWVQHSPAQAMRRVWPLLTWPTTLRRPASISHTKGMHCGAAERKERATVRVPAAREEGRQPCSPQLNTDHAWRGGHSTIGAEEFAQGDEHKLLAHVPRGLQVALELGHHQGEVRPGQSHQDIAGSCPHIAGHALKKSLW